MPFTTPPKPERTPGEIAADASKADTLAAEAADSGEGSSIDNLTVVETKPLPAPTPGTLRAYSHPQLRLTKDHLAQMSRLEILSVGGDRGYWTRGVSMLSKSQLEAQFIEAQDQDPDPRLHDHPAAS